MKKVVIVFVVVLLGYFGYRSFMMPSNEQVLENSFQKMALLDEKDTQNNVSEKDVTFEEETQAVKTPNTEVGASIDAALADISGFSGTESSDPFEGL